MDTGRSAPSREERLAAKLRENLYRRKAQARAADSAGKPGSPGTAKESLAKGAPKR